MGVDRDPGHDRGQRESRWCSRYCENISGRTGQQLLQAAQDALSWGTAAAYFGALIVGVGTMVILRGLRGVEMLRDD